MIDIRIFKNIWMTVFHTGGCFVVNSCTKMQELDQWLTGSEVCIGSLWAKQGFSPCGPHMKAAILVITAGPVSWPAAQQSGKVNLSWFAIYGKKVVVTLRRSCDEQAGGRLCLNVWMKNCNELAFKAVTAVFHTEIKAADFPSLMFIPKYAGSYLSSELLLAILTV